MQYYSSLHSIHLDELADRIGGRHRLTYLVSERLKQVSAGSPLLVERKQNEALLAAVCREIAEGKIWIDVPEEEILEEQEEFDMFDMGEDI